ncbi:MAG: GHKL domain-containing protein [Lachnospiraceae bacterium]|nr:GHKL domain-containing protein [Lachnospiraceae bacterium]
MDISALFGNILDNAIEGSRRRTDTICERTITVYEQ